MNGNEGLTASDVALLTGNNNGWGMEGGWGSMIWLFAIIALMGGWGNGGFGGGNGYHPQYATQDFVQNGFNFNDLQDQNRDLMNAVTNSAAQAVAATNQAKYDNINVAKDIQAALTAQIGDIRTNQMTLLANQNQCCCDTRMAMMEGFNGINAGIAQARYENAMNTASINQTTNAGVQKIIDAITGNRMADMQNQIDALQLQNALNGVVRYPSGWTYNAGNNPFCNNNGCGCNGFNM